MPPESPRGPGRRASHSKFPDHGHPGTHIKEMAVVIILSHGDMLNGIMTSIDPVNVVPISQGTRKGPVRDPTSTDEVDLRW